MELPKPPEDNELKNIIDKLANFVARNGPEFEQMTKQKQKNNAKFSFLFGGEHFNYYQYKVTTEQAIMNQQNLKAQQQQQLGVQLGLPPDLLQRGPPPIIPGQSPAPQMIPQTRWQQPPQAMTQPGPSQPPATQQGLPQQLEQARKNTLEQIKQSETNLAAQYASLMQQRQAQVDEAITLKQEEELQNLFVECKITREEFDRVLLPITESCTKDAISTGKNWIFTHNQTENNSQLIALYLKKLILAQDMTFGKRLHLIYLINDLLHHCIRKNAEPLRKFLELFITPIFCATQSSALEDQKQKLSKLLSLWETNKYFDATILKELTEPGSAAMTKYAARLAKEYPSLVSQVTQAVNVRYTSLQQQHQEFVNHLNSQLQQIEQQLQLKNPPDTLIVAAQPQIPASTVPAQPTPAAPLPGNIPPGNLPNFPPPDLSQPPPNFSQPPPGFSGGPPQPQPAQFDYGHGQSHPTPMVQEYNHGRGTATPPPDRANLPPLPAGLPGPGALPGGPGGPPIFPVPDFTKPPPGFPPLPGVPPMMLPKPAVSEADLMPSVPYFELPAGLMAPLVKLEDCNYKALIPKDIRLPPPMPPNERLLAAVEAFYSGPSHERPRDGDGWEKLGLFEFFKVKEKAKKMKEQQRKEQGSDGSSSSSSSRSSTPSSSPSRSRSRSPRRPRQRSRSRSNSVPYQRASRSKSRSPSRSRSRSPEPRKSRERSLTPEFTMPFFATNTDMSLGDENKGRMLLKKMGWGGGGLGSTEQGIVDPVKHAEVRDRVDMFKGLGMSNNDPFEQFRKSKSQGFVQRMKERDV